MSSNRQSKPMTVTSIADVDPDGRFDAADVAAASEAFGVKLRRPLPARTERLLGFGTEPPAPVVHEEE